jgi:hypothetical protein
VTQNSRHTPAPRRAVLVPAPAAAKPPPALSGRLRRAYAGPLLALFVGVLAALSLAGPAAASACGDKILADWFDNGRVDRLYPLHCYEEAIDSIPADIRDYADAEDVISRALQAAVGGKLAPGGPDPTPGDGNSGGGNGSNGGSGGNGSGGTNGEAVGAVDTSGPSSVPIPLIVLGGMSLALLAAGALGYFSRRRQAAAADDDPDDPTLV